MHQYRIDEWVIYRQFLDADSESLREGKRAVVLDCIDGKRYEIYIDDPNLDEKWRRKIVNEVNLKAIN
jgi:hypothetical protein